MIGKRKRKAFFPAEAMTWEEMDRRDATRYGDGKRNVTVTPPIPPLLQKRCLYCDKIINHLPGNVCTECTLRGYDTEAITVDVGPGTYSEWTLPDGRTVHFPTIVMAAPGQLVLTVPRQLAVSAPAEPDTLTVAEAQQMLDEANQQIAQATAERAAGKRPGSSRTRHHLDVNPAPQPEAPRRSSSRKISRF